MKRVVAACALLLSPVVAAAQSTASFERGFDPAKLYQFEDIDRVALINGNVAISIPVGPRYPVGGEFSYQLSLDYNSKVWDWEQFYFRGSEVAEALPNRQSNAGMGWALSLGQLLDPDDPDNPYQDDGDWAYVSPDGGEHVFYPLLHSYDVENDPANAYSYTRDGSYLRMVAVSTTTRTIELPNGDIHTFTRYPDPALGGNYRWRITQQRDRFQNALNIAYSADENTWTLTDTQGRTHYAFFRDNALGTYRKTLVRVDLAGFGSSTITYQLVYNPSPITINKPCGQTFPERFTVTVPFLQEIRLPDGSSYFPEYQLAAPADTCHSWGAIKKLTLPTKARLEYTWGLWQLPIEGCSVREWYRFSAGLTQRRIVDHQGGEIASWTYQPQLSTPPVVMSASCDSPSQIYHAPPEELKVTVTTPLKDKTVSYFSVFPGVFEGTYAGPFRIEDYGLPFTKRVTDATGTRYLSTEVFDCDSAGNNCGTTPMRATYVRYERDNVLGICGAPGLTSECTDHLARRVSERMVYNDDAGKISDVDESGFDGFGHLRTRATNGNWGTSDVKSWFTNYNPGVVTWPLTQPWVLGTYTETTIVEGGTTVRAQHCFDGATGFLLRHRQLKNPAGLVRANDVLKVYTADIAGNVAKESYFGGDIQTLSTSSDLCNLALPTNAQGQWADQYRMINTYQFGVLATRRFADQADASTGTLAFLDADRTIDRTGVVASSRDPSGLQTTFEYDAMLRLAYDKPQDEAWTQYVYTNADLTAVPPRLAAVDIVSRTSVGTVLVTRRVEFDALGRVARETRSLPAGVTSARATTYTPGGQVATLSEWQTGTPNRFTRNLDHDPFGRPRRVEPADGVNHAITYVYIGDRRVEKTAKVGTSRDAGGNIVEEAINTAEVYDRQGRLFRVRELSRPGSLTPLDTDYSYHPLDRVATVRNDVNAQARNFTYDGRGFLGSEQHPELGTTGNGIVTYTYDARGMAVRRIEGAVNGSRDLSFDFDRAGRLLRVRETASGRLLKEFTYASANVGTNKALAKIQTAVRHNWIVPPGGMSEVDVAITETYVYAGRQGRISQRDTAFSSAPTFTQSFAYNDLGLLSSLTYPRCTHAPCAGSDPPRTVSFAYDQGYLTSVPGFASALTYHPNGMVHRVTHANNVVDTQALDPNAMQRPASYSTSGVVPAASNWSSGTYQYDGMGNIVRVGADYYVYDRASRLATGSALSAGTGAVQSYAYDGFGNLTQITTGTPGTIQTFAVDALVNRLQASTTVAYDEGGNLVRWGSQTYSFDAFNQLKASGIRTHLYTADDQRIYTLEWNGSWPASNERWSLRGLDGRVLRDLLSHGNTAGQWSWTRDFVYRGPGLLLASPSPVGGRHMSLDHLGSVRVVTDDAAGRLGYHAYYGFGQEATDPGQNKERLRFTGHERDSNDAGTADDLDYMRARYFHLTIGRMLSVDPAPADPRMPQSWNRYAYVTSNPMRYNDPDGRRQNPVTGGRGIETVPKNGELGRIRTNTAYPKIGQYGYTRIGGKKFHAGVDINAPQGTPVFAAEGGVVAKNPASADGGKVLTITMADGTVLTYSHLSAYSKSVPAGSRVVEGQIVGYAGKTGNAGQMPPSEEHLHFSVTSATGQRQNPVDWLNDPNAADPKIRSEIPREVRLEDILEPPMCTAAGGLTTCPNAPHPQ